MDENERKRKRELGIEEDDEDHDVEEKHEPKARPAKKPRTSGEDQTSKNATTATADDETERHRAKAEKRRQKREQKKEKADRKKERKAARKDAGHEEPLDEVALKKKDEGRTDSIDGEDDLDGEEAPEIDAIDMSDLVDHGEVAEAEDSSVPTSPNPDSPAFDVSANQSAASSSSSIVPPATAPEAIKPYGSEAAGRDGANDSPKRKEKAFELPKLDPEELQARLRTRIEALRARRKADGADGQPAKTRQELLEQRRKKSEVRKQHKKELRQKAKQEEERLKNEQLRGSGSPLSVDIFSPRSPLEPENNFSFGRVAFDDGQQTDGTLDRLIEPKKKGPQDPKTALESAQRKADRIKSYDPSKRADIEEKDTWLNAKKRVHGERVRDDQSLLKKALKRKEKTKAKSEKEWNERIEGVKRGKEVRQKKRDDNLAKRKDERGGKKAKAKSAGAAKGKKKGRPGFEGKLR